MLASWHFYTKSIPCQRCLYNFHSDLLLIPAIELGLLQRDVSIRIELSFFLHISFSFLWDVEWKNRHSELEFLTSNSCSVCFCMLSDSPLTCNQLQCLGCLQGVCGCLSLQLNEKRKQCIIGKLLHIIKFSYVQTGCLVLIIPLYFNCGSMSMSSSKLPSWNFRFCDFFWGWKKTAIKMSLQHENYTITVSHMKVLTLLTPASSRISFISPSSVGIVICHCHSLFRHKAMYRTLVESSYLYLLHPPLHPLWWSVVRLTSLWSHAQPWHSFSALGWWLRNSRNLC